MSTHTYTSAGLFLRQQNKCIFFSSIEIHLFKKKLNSVALILFANICHYFDNRKLSLISLTCKDFKRRRRRRECAFGKVYVPLYSHAK